MQLVPVAGPVSVRVAARGTGDTLNRASVHVMAAPGQGGFLHPARFSRAATAHDGTAEFELPPGRYDVTAGAHGYVAESRRFTIRSGTESLVVTLTPEP